MVFLGQMMLLMTSLSSASMLPPPPLGISLGGMPSPVAAPALAVPALAPRSDDPFLAFLRTAGVETSSEAPLPEADPEAEGASGERVKRTGNVLGPLLNNKLSYLTKGSHHVHFHNYGAANKCDKWSLWDFKKAILAKLLEAAKAIGGGVLALKGKLLTFKGHLVEVKGRKLAEKGEALAEFGKGVIAKVLGHGTTGHSAPSAPSGPSAALSIPPSGGGYGHVPPAHPPPPHGGYGVPTGHGGGHGHAPGGGYDAAASLLDDFNTYGFDRNSEHRRGTIHAGLLVLQPLKRQANLAFAPRSTAPGRGVAPSAPDMVSSASETSEEHVLEPLRLSPSHTPLVLAPEVMDSLTTEVGVPVDSANDNASKQPQGSPSETNENWVPPPDHLPVHTQAALPSRLLSANSPGLFGISPQSPEAAMAKVIARLHGQSSHLSGETSKRRR